MRRFLGELKRRKVYRAAAIYLLLAIGGLELADVLVPSTSLPEWTDGFLIVVAIVGFPIVVVIAWMFEVGPGGIGRTPSPDGTVAEPSPGVRSGSGSEAAKTADSATVGPPPASGPTDRRAVPATEESDADQTGEGRLDLDPHTVAVLPFANLSGADDAEPFAAGLHDDLLTELSRASALTVISRTSVQAFRETNKTMRQIGRELRAGTIVEGGVQKAGDRVRLNVQLIDARNDVHLWAERYDRELSAGTIFELQMELAKEIMGRLRATLTGEEEAAQQDRPTEDLDAYREYSIGRACFVERSAEALGSAAEHFEAAVERDPGYALAWAGLSLALTMLVDYRHVDSDETFARAGSAARRALELDSDLAEAHSALGCWYSARRECRKALAAHTKAAELRPGYAGAHQWRCWTSLLIGDAGTAVEAGQQAVRLDPMDPEARGNLVLAHVGCHEEEEALRVARTGAAQRSQFDWIRWPEAVALLHLGRAEEGSALLRNLTEVWARHWPATTEALDRLRAGDEPGARRALSDYKARDALFHAGLLHLALGEPDEGFGAIFGALPLLWDEVLYLRFFRGWPLSDYGSEPRWKDLLDALDRAWGA